MRSWESISGPYGRVVSVAVRAVSCPGAYDLVDALACQVVLGGDLLQGFAVVEALTDDGVAFAVRLSSWCERSPLPVG